MALHTVSYRQKIIGTDCRRLKDLQHVLTLKSLNGRVSISFSLEHNHVALTVLRQATCAEVIEPSRYVLYVIPLSAVWVFLHASK
jgi:hypothetical protein